MDQFNAQIGVAPHAWLQHHLPWLGLLALMLGLFRENPDAGFERDELNG